MPRLFLFFIWNTLYLRGAEEIILAMSVTLKPDCFDRKTSKRLIIMEGLFAEILYCLELPRIA